MKKQVFTLLIMLVLVALTGKTFAQRTPIAPYEGATVNYVVNGLTDGDTYVWGIGTTERSYTTVAGDYSVVSTPALGVTGTVDGTTATLTVDWLSGADGDHYFVWIQIIDNSGCSTYRYLPVNPVAAGAYHVEFSVLALLVGDGNTDPDDITNPLIGVQTLSDCPKFVGANFVSTTGAGDPASNGSSYVYFRIQRNSTDLPSTSWEVTPSSDFTGTATWESSTDATVWSNCPLDDPISPIDGNDVIYLRATVLNSTSAQAITVTITGNDIIPTTEDITYDPDNATLTLDPLPIVGTFSGSN